jgi:hypothetical protein
MWRVPAFFTALDPLRGVRLRDGCESSDPGRGMPGRSLGTGSISVAPLLFVVATGLPAGGGEQVFGASSGAAARSTLLPAGVGVTPTRAAGPVWFIAVVRRR